MLCAAVNIARDSYSSYVGHHPMLEYFAIAQNESIGRVRYEFLQKMLLPCGELYFPVYCAIVVSCLILCTCLQQ